MLEFCFQVSQWNENAPTLTFCFRGLEWIDLLLSYQFSFFRDIERDFETITEKFFGKRLYLNAPMLTRGCFFLIQLAHTALHFAEKFSISWFYERRKKNKKSRKLLLLSCVFPSKSPPSSFSQICKMHEWEFKIFYCLWAIIIICKNISGEQISRYPSFSIRLTSFIARLAQPMNNLAPTHQQYVSVQKTCFLKFGTVETLRKKVLYARTLQKIRLFFWIASVRVPGTTRVHN